MITFTITAQIRAAGDSPEAVIKQLREQLAGMQVEEIKIKPAKGRS